MKFVYLFFAVLGLLAGFFFWTRADTAANQIEVLLIWLSATVLLVAMEVRNILEELRSRHQPEPAKQSNPGEAVVTAEMIEQLSAKVNRTKTA